MLRRRTGRNAKLGYWSGKPRRFFDDLDRNSLALGCTSCPYLGVCGGLHVDSGAFDCLDYCCQRRKTCDGICVKNPNRFVARTREIGGFEFDDIPRGRKLARPPLPAVVPLVYHGSSRTTAFGAPTIALPLYRLFDRNSGRLKYRSHQSLCKSFRISSKSALLITGTDHDQSLERWWSLGLKRKEILAQLSELPVAAITSPNFSLFSNTPRWDDLHSMKRIAITWEEMLQAGLASALHLNARTTHDWRRWSGFIRTRPEVNLLAFEFATGARTPERMQWYADRLSELASEVDRALTLVCRGGAPVIGALRQWYTICSVDSTPFMKAVKRQRGDLRAEGGIRWHSARDNGSSVVDELLSHNYSIVVENHLVKLAAYGRGPHRN